MSRDLNQSKKASRALTSQDLSTSREQRAEPRIICSKPIDLLPCKSSNRKKWEFVTAELVDCSPHGAGFIVDMQLAPGDQFLVKLVLKSVSMLLYTVRNCTPLPDRRWRIGAEFTGMAASPQGDDSPTLMAMLENCSNH